ncbi:MFS general substrate transporter, partial [Coemansia reversa NRRL 1564]
MAHEIAATEYTTLLAKNSSNICDPRRPTNSCNHRTSPSVVSVNSGHESNQESTGERKPLTAWKLLCMTVLLAGIQFVWTVEMGYGTPYLLSLGLSKPLMTLVWMAGPLSGLLIQPIVGRLSDKCSSSLGRRRPYIIGGAAFVIGSVITIAYAKELASCLARILNLTGGNGTSGGIPGSDFQIFVTRTSIALAVIGFYVLDFSINTSQACARALALDIPPLYQQDLANAYAGRMLNLGSVTGYMVGFMDLRALLPWKTDSQMQALCLIATAAFTLTIVWTCISVHEVPLVLQDDDMSSQLEANECGRASSSYRQGRISISDSRRSEWADMFSTVVRGIAQLPTPVQRVCNVQFFAWVAWFPFLFFSTTWVTEIMARSADPSDPDFIERATRAGSFALFLYSVISLGCSMVMPLFVEDEANSSSLHSTRSPLKVSLRTMWRVSLLTMGIILLATYFVTDVRAATILIICMAFPWALAMWAPFALVGEYTTISAEQSSTSTRQFAENEQVSQNTTNLKTAPATPTATAPSVPIANDLRNEGDDGEDYIVGSHATAVVSGNTAPLTSSWRRPYELLGYRASAQLAALRGDSIASTIQGSDELPVTIPNSVSPAPLSQYSSRSPSSPKSIQGLGVLQQTRGDSMDLSSVSEHSDYNETENRVNISNIQHDKLDTGTVLGIHNMYVVFPQFVINGISSLIFAWFGRESTNDSSHGIVRSVEFMAMDVVLTFLAGDIGNRNEAIGTVLRIGGFSAFIAAAMSYFLFDRQRVRAYVVQENQR